MPCYSPVPDVAECLRCFSQESSHERVEKFKALECGGIDQSDPAVLYVSLN